MLVWLQSHHSFSQTVPKCSLRPCRVPRWPDSVRVTPLPGRCHSSHFTDKDNITSLPIAEWEKLCPNTRPSWGSPGSGVHTGHPGVPKPGDMKATGAGTYLGEGPIGEDHQQRRLPAAAVAHQDHLDRPRTGRRLLARRLGRLHPGRREGRRRRSCGPAGGCAQGQADAGQARRGRNVEGAGRREEVRAGRPRGGRRFQGGWRGPQPR